MTETTNYKLKKPGYEDYVDIGALNANADVIDAELHKLNAGKSDTVKPSAAGNLAALAADGKLQDSGRKPGAKNGVATLDENGHIPGDQLPNSFLPLKGGTMSGPINMNGQRITGLPKPAAGNDPMRKDDGASSATMGLFGLGSDGTLDDVLQKLAGAAFDSGGTITDVNGNPLGVRIATGSYVGTGKYGPDNPNSLTFDGNPQMVVVSIVSELGCAGAYPDYFDGWSEGNFMWVKGATYSGGYSGTIDILETEHGISWNTASNQDASKQCNKSGKTYRYFAIVN